MISEAVRKEVMERDHGECQFWHREPVEATEISHFDHQGIGGLPPDHWKNQAPNLASSCGECHRKIHAPKYEWEGFVPLEVRLTDPNAPYITAHMTIYYTGGEQISEMDLWFYVRHEATRLQQVEARIQGLAMIEGDVARDLYELSKGYKLLEPDAVSFAQYIAGRNVSATKATQAARAYGWMDERGLAWPVGLTSEKADIIRKAMESAHDLAGFAVAVQVWLDAAVDQSVSDLKQQLIDEKLIKPSVRWYVHIRLEPLIEECPILGGQLMLVRARKVEDVLVANSRVQSDIVLRADKFVAGLNWDRKTKVLSDRDGNEVPYKDLT